MDIKKTSIKNISIIIVIITKWMLNIVNQMYLIMYLLYSFITYIYV